MGLYKQPKSENWYVRFAFHGREYRRSTGTSDRREAEVVARRIRTDIEARRPVVARVTRVRLIDLVGFDVERAMAVGVTDAQIASIALCWRHLCAHFGVDADPQAITYEALEAYLRHRRQSGARGQSLRKERQALSRGLKIAKRRGLIAEILEDWPTIRNDPPNARQRGKLHPPDVIAQWLAALEAEPKGWAARRQAEVALLTGLRAHELRRLTWRWVVLARTDSEPVPAYLHLPAEATKTRQPRPIGLVPRALELLRELAQGKGPDEPLLPGVYAKAFRHACVRMGYDQVITLRDLRHVHGTWGSCTGDVRAVQAALGHADLHTTARYLHATVGRTAAISVAVAEELEKAQSSGQTAGRQRSL